MAVRGRTVQVSRWLWQRVHGPIPRGLFVLHACDRPPCCNLDHLFLGDAQLNALDAVGKGRINPRRGSQHPRAKLTEQQVPEIRAALARCESKTALGRQYGVWRTAIWFIGSRKTWRHVPV